MRFDSRQTDSSGTLAQFGVWLSSPHTVMVTNASSAPFAKKFTIKNSAGTPVASIDEKGDMYLAGVVSENNTILGTALNPTPYSFIVQNKSGNTIAYINSTGFAFIGATLSQGAAMSVINTNVEIWNASTSLVGFFDNNGSLRLKGNLYENYTGP